MAKYQGYRSGAIKTTQPRSEVSNIPRSGVYTIGGKKAAVIVTPKEESAPSQDMSSGSGAKSVTQATQEKYAGTKYDFGTSMLTPRTTTENTTITYRPLSSEPSRAKEPAPSMLLRRPTEQTGQPDRSGRVSAIIPYGTSVKDGKLSINPFGISVIREQVSSSPYDVTFSADKYKVVYPREERKITRNIESISFLGDQYVTQVEERDEPVQKTTRISGHVFSEKSFVGKVTAPDVVKTVTVSRAYGGELRGFRVLGGFAEYKIVSTRGGKEEVLYSSKKEMGLAFPGGETVDVGRLATVGKAGYSFQREYKKAGGRVPLGGVPPVAFEYTIGAVKEAPRIGKDVFGKISSLSARSRASAEVGVVVALGSLISKGSSLVRLSPASVKLSERGAAKFGVFGAGKKVSVRDVKLGIFTESEVGKNVFAQWKYWKPFDTPKVSMVNYRQEVVGLAGSFKTSKGVVRGERFAIVQKSVSYDVTPKGKQWVQTQTFIGGGGASEGEVVTLGTEFTKLRGRKNVMMSGGEGYYGRAVQRFGKTTISEGARFKLKRLGTDVVTTSELVPVRGRYSDYNPANIKYVGQAYVGGKRVEGYFDIGKDKVVVSTKGRSAGQVSDTVWHELEHRKDFLLDTKAPTTSYSISLQFSKNMESVPSNIKSSWFKQTKSDLMSAGYRVGGNLRKYFSRSRGGHDFRIESDAFAREQYSVISKSEITTPLGKAYSMKFEAKDAWYNRPLTYFDVKTTTQKAPVYGVRWRSKETFGYTRQVMVDTPEGLRFTGYAQGRVGSSPREVWSERLLGQVQRKQVFATDPLTATVLSLERPKVRRPSFAMSEELLSARSLGRVRPSTSYGVRLQTLPYLSSSSFMSSQANRLSTPSTFMSKISMFGASKNVFDMGAVSVSRLTGDTGTGVFSRQAVGSRVVTDQGLFTSQRVVTGGRGGFGGTPPPPPPPPLVFGFGFPGLFDMPGRKKGGGGRGKRAFSYRKSFSVTIGKFKAPSLKKLQKFTGFELRG